MQLWRICLCDMLTKNIKYVIFYFAFLKKYINKENINYQFSVML